MNSNLYGKTYSFPDSLKQHLKVCFRLCPDANSNVEGYRRNQELQNAKSITYQQLKRMKNWFDNYQGRKEDAPYVLNGGDKVRNWIENTLGSSRNSIKTTQDRAKEYTVDNSEFIDIVPNIAKVDANNSKMIQKFDNQVTENLKKINDLMKKLL